MVFHVVRTRTEQFASLAAHVRRQALQRVVTGHRVSSLSSWHTLATQPRITKSPSDPTLPVLKRLCSAFAAVGRRCSALSGQTNITVSNRQRRGAGVLQSAFARPASGQPRLVGRGFGKRGQGRVLSVVAEPHASPACTVRPSPMDGSWADALSSCVCVVCLCGARSERARAIAANICKRSLQGQPAASACPPLWCVCTDFSSVSYSRPACRTAA